MTVIPKRLETNEITSKFLYLIARKKLSGCGAWKGYTQNVAKFQSWGNGPQRLGRPNAATVLRESTR